MAASYDLDAFLAGLTTLGAAPGEGSGGTTKHNVLRNDYGDGQSQRVRYGLNNKKRKETYVWDALPIDIGTQVLDFLNARGNDEAFYYTPPDGSGVQRQFTIEGDVGHRYHKGGQAITITATLQEEFDL